MSRKGKQNRKHSTTKANSSEWDLKMSRPGFMKARLAAGIVAGGSVLALDGKDGLRALQVTQTSQIVSTTDRFVAQAVTLNVNGVDYPVNVEPRDMLVNVIRDDIGLIGTKRPCNRIECGGCTVLIDDVPYNACQYIAPRLSGEKKLKEVKGATGVLFSIMSPFMRVTPTKPDVLLRDADEIAGLSVVHTPGHTDGSICLCKGNEAIFVGDALRTDSSGKPLLPPKSMTVDMKRARESVKRIAACQFGSLLPGHGPPITQDASRVVVDFVKGAL